MQFLKELINTSHPIIRCQEWSKLISALACQSPVCAHPNDQLFNLLKKIGEKAKAPFHYSKSEFVETAIPMVDQFQELSHFPHLLSVRTCGVYEADKHLCKATGCTKHSSGHPSSLPGLFTPMVSKNIPHYLKH